MHPREFGKLARRVLACAAAGVVLYFAAKGAYYDICGADRQKSAGTPATVVSKGAYSITSDNRIKFIDGIVIRCEDAETAAEAAKRMDIAISCAPKTNTDNDYARRARISIDKAIEDGIIYRREMGLLPKR